MLLTRPNRFTRSVAAILWLSMMAACGMDAAAPGASTSNPSTPSTTVATEGAAAITRVALLNRNGSERASLSAPFTVASGPSEAELDAVLASLKDGSLEAKIKDPAIKKMMQQARTLAQLIDANDFKVAAAYIRAHRPPAGVSRSPNGAGSVVTVASGGVDVLKYWTTNTVAGGRPVGIGGEPANPPVSFQECYEEQCTETCDMNGCDGITYAEVQAAQAEVAGMEADMVTVLDGIELDTNVYVPGDDNFVSVVDVNYNAAMGPNCFSYRVAAAAALINFLANVALTAAAFNSGPPGWMVGIGRVGATTAAYAAVGLAVNAYWNCRGL